jgi:hypothetical protein
MDERRLRKFFHFTENDLEANRRGQFSENQKNRLLAEARTEKKSARDSAVILFVIAAAGLALGVTLGSIAPTPFSRILFLGVLGVLWPSVWAWRAVTILRAAHKLQQPRLLSVSGHAELIRHTDADHVLQIGEVEFDLDGDPAGVIMEDDEYTVYYLEATQEILSMDIPIRGK